MTVKNENAENVNSILKSKKSSTFSELNKTEKSFKKFLAGFNSKATKKAYMINLDNFCKFKGYRGYDSIIKKSNSSLEEDVLEYMIHLKENGNRHATLLTLLSSLKAFFEINSKALNYMAIKRVIGTETKQRGNRKAYKLDQVQRMFNVAGSLRTQALVLTLASSGMRRGAVVELKVRNLKRQADGGALVVVYEDDKEEYVTGLTPEAVFYIDKLLDERRNLGLKINEDSYLFTAKAGRINPTNEKMNDEAISIMIQKIVKRAKLDLAKKDRRKEVATVHGLRKFFKTQCHGVKYAVNDKTVQAIDTSIIEQLMGHSQNTVKMTYLDTTEKELYREYQKAIPSLTISQEWRYKNESNRLKEEINNAETEEMTQLKRNIAEMQVKLEESNPESVSQEAQVQYNSHLEDKVAELTAVVQKLVQENQELTKPKAKTVKQTKPLAVENTYSRY